MALAADPNLSALANKKVFFAHQSVGENVLHGLSELAQEAGVALRIEESVSPEALRRPGIVHARVGKNEDPKSKLAHFETLLDGPGAGADVALLKFCYVDFNADTDARALFAAYLEKVEAVKRKHPALKLVHVTAPLTTVQSGVKGFLKNALGRAAAGEKENQARARYNALLRAEFAGKEPIFDLAAVEAGQGAAACSFTRDGERWPCLRPELTDDGGHLNARGQREAATALVEAIAGIPRSP
jgi:hypothetical protein